MIHAVATPCIGHNAAPTWLIANLIRQCANLGTLCITLVTTKTQNILTKPLYGLISIPLLWDNKVLNEMNESVKMR